MDIKLGYTLHKAAAGDSPGIYRITKRQITIAEDWKSDPGRTLWSAESCKCLTVDDGQRLSHDLRSVTVTSGKRLAQHCWVHNNASTHHFKLVTHLSPLGVPQCYVTAGTFARHGLSSTAKTLRSLFGGSRF